MTAAEALTQGRAAFQRRDWLAAYEGLSAVGDDAMRGADFADLATAAYLLQRFDDCVAALQRAHQSYLAARETAPAVRTAFWLALVLRIHGEFAVANGWVTRAEGLAADLPEASVEHGYIEYARLQREVLAGGIRVEPEQPARILEYGRRFGDPNLIAAGLMSSGRTAIYRGDVAEGLAFLDEAVVTILNGGLSPILAGGVLCAAIDGCQELCDFSRIDEWTRALDTWCSDQTGLEEFQGTCSMHKGQVLAQHGDFDDALVEYEGAVERFLRAGNNRALGSALCELADVLRVLGRFEAADAALRRSSEAGWDPVSVQAMLDLARDRIDAAAASGRRMLAESRSPIHRAQKLGRVVEVLLATGDLAGAAPVVDELSTVAVRLATPMFLGFAGRARGTLALARGECVVAQEELRGALDRFAAATADYEVARTRLLLADALTGCGDPDAGERERIIATACLARMGAAQPISLTESGPLTTRQVEVLGMVALGCSNREIAKAMNLSEKTVARHLSNIFTKLEVGSRTAAAAYAFDHGMVASFEASGPHREPH